MAASVRWRSSCDPVFSHRTIKPLTRLAQSAWQISTGSPTLGGNVANQPYNSDPSVRYVMYLVGDCSSPPHFRKRHAAISAYLKCPKQRTSTTR